MDKKNNISLVLTLDYELWGDGSGNLFQQIIIPTNSILNICKENKIKITIFFEAIEYIKLKEEWEKGNSMGYNKNPIQAIEDQLQKAALDGHDIQLHIHPQWANAEYSNGKWEIDESNWRLGDFRIESDYSVENLIRDGKEALESIITTVLPEYKCFALRAGWYNIMPSRKIYTAMQNLGLKLDSSIYPGGYETGEIRRYDYRKIPLTLDYWWADSNDITKISKNNKEIIEVPIFSLMQPRWKKLVTPRKISTLIINRELKISPTTKTKIKNMPFIEKIKFLFKKE